jgi:hypothetical protein
MIEIRKSFSTWAKWKFHVLKSIEDWFFRIETGKLLELLFILLFKNILTLLSSICCVEKVQKLNFYFQFNSNRILFKLEWVDLTSMIRMRDEIFYASLIEVMRKCLSRIQINSWMQLCEQSKYNTVKPRFWQPICKALALLWLI